MSENTLTVVISSYKYGHLAGHCIDSVISQTRKPDTIMFLDDGVGDCKHLPSIYPEVEYILREKNLGTLKNFDDALKRVKTKYTMFLGADNWLRSDAVELLLQDPEDIVTYDIMITGEFKSSFSFNEMTKLHNDNYNGDVYWNRDGKHHGSMMYNTQMAQEVGYRKYPGAHYGDAEDYNLWTELIKKNAKVKYLKEALLYYRRHRENFITTNL